MLFAVAGAVFFASCEKEVPVYKIIIPQNITVVEGGKFPLMARFLPKDATNKKLTWSSDNPEVAMYDPVTGEVTGIAIGTATITALSDDGGITDKCEVAVCPPSLAGTSWKSRWIQDESWWPEGTEIQIDFTETEATYSETHDNGVYLHFTGTYTYDPPVVVVSSNYWIEGEDIGEYRVEFPYDITHEGTVDGKTMIIIIETFDWWSTWTLEKRQYHPL